MTEVRMYCTHSCGYCTAAERLLEKKGIAVEKVYIDEQPERRAEMSQATGGRTSVPQIMVGTRHLGGYRELAQLEISDELDKLLLST
jgi:glutaredoxin 3